MVGPQQWAKMLAREFGLQFISMVYPTICTLLMFSVRWIASRHIVHARNYLLTSIDYETLRIHELL